MNDVDLAAHILDRLWRLRNTDGIDVNEYKSRAEELLFLYARMQKTAPEEKAS